MSGWRQSEGRWILLHIKITHYGLVVEFYYYLVNKTAWEENSQCVAEAYHWLAGLAELGSDSDVPSKSGG